MPQATEPPANVRWVVLALLFAALAVATPACEPLDVPEAGLGDENATRDAAPAADVTQGADRAADISISPETSTDSGADGPRSSDGGSTNDGTDIQGADTTADTTDAANDATRDTEIEDAAPDSPADAGIDDSDGSSLDADADAGAPIADAVVPDGDDADGSLTPIFPTCTYVASLGSIPAAIIDAASDLVLSYPPGCSCTVATHARCYRILCGSFSAQSAVVYVACPAGSDVPTGQREIMTLPQLGSNCGTDAGAFSHVARPLSDWDLLLNEQIAGHADSGGHD